MGGGVEMILGVWELRVVRGLRFCMGYRGRGVGWCGSSRVIEIRVKDLVFRVSLSGWYCYCFFF